MALRSSERLFVVAARSQEEIEAWEGVIAAALDPIAVGGDGAGGHGTPFLHATGADIGAERAGLQGVWDEVSATAARATDAQGGGHKAGAQERLARLVLGEDLSGTGAGANMAHT